MHPSEVQKQVQYDYEKFMNNPYGKHVPEYLLDFFEKALMVIPPQSHGVLFSKVKNIISKEIKDLSVSDLNDIVKVVVNTSLAVFYDSLYDAIPEQIKFEKFVLAFNNHIKEFQENLNEKKKRLESLSDGVLKTSNGMRIIPNGNSY